MTDMLAAKRATMACRIYLKLFDAGASGANITKADAIGPRDSEDSDWPRAVEVIARFVDDTILDETGHQGGFPHYSLTRVMRDRMKNTLVDSKTLAEALRSELAAWDAGDEVPAERFCRFEALIRTGDDSRDPI